MSDIHPIMKGGGRKLLKLKEARKQYMKEARKQYMKESKEEERFKEKKKLKQGEERGMEGKGERGEKKLKNMTCSRNNFLKKNLKRGEG